MTLFDSAPYFNEGKKQYIDFNLADTELRLWEQYFAPSESNRYYTTLSHQTPWQQRVRVMYDRMVQDPRLTAYYGGANGHPWTQELLEIKSIVEQTCAVRFDRVLLNYYRDGNDSVAWHSDTLPSDGVHHPIASVTFGDTRLFKVRHKTKKDEPQISIPLTHGSLLLMGETMQSHYEHHVPKTARTVGPRINLTFRISESSKPVYFDKAFATRSH